MFLHIITYLWGKHHTELYLWICTNIMLYLRNGAS